MLLPGMSEHDYFLVLTGSTEKGVMSVLVATFEKNAEALVGMSKLDFPEGVLVELLYVPTGEVLFSFISGEERCAKS